MKLTRTPVSYTIEILQARIKELEEGSCRHHCITKKEAFIAGFGYGDNSEMSLHRADTAYKEWINEKDN